MFDLINHKDLTSIKKYQSKCWFVRPDRDVGCLSIKDKVAMARAGG